MSGETPGQEGQDFVAPDETMGEAQTETTELNSESQATMVELDKTLKRWNNEMSAKSMTPYSDRRREYMMNNIPLLENLKFDLQAGKTTFIDTSERPHRKAKIADKLEKIDIGLTKIF